jgi:aspartate aminotransferase
MKLSSRVQNISESITLKLNAKAVAMADSGVQVYNLTAGQLPFRPTSDFVGHIRGELDFLKSYQYSPVPGFPELRKKILAQVEKTRGVSFADYNFDCAVSNGGKHAITNVLSCLVDKGDEVITLAPYWVSYPEMIKFCQGTPVVVESSFFNAYVPSVSEIESKITSKTKVVIINSPNNPAGISYSEEWMRDFGEMMTRHQDITILSDEIYYQLYYYDPKPACFYQTHPELLKRTVIIDGISKTLASTGLRIGFTLAPKEFIGAITKLQGQTSSGANSLIQRALMQFDFDKVEEFLAPIKKHLRENSEVIREKLRESNMANSWYQSSSAFYYLLDFSKSPCFENLRKEHPEVEDLSPVICEQLLEDHGVAMVPGTAFGAPNTARLSLVSPRETFEQAVDRIVAYLKGN